MHDQVNIKLYGANKHACTTSGVHDPDWSKNLSDCFALYIVATCGYYYLNSGML